MLAAPEPLNFGLRLAHAVLALSKAVRSEGESVVRVVAPLEGGDPAPPAPGLNPPVENVTPWLFRQASYAAKDAAVEPPDVVVVLEPAALADPLLQAASRTQRLPRADTSAAALSRWRIFPCTEPGCGRAVCSMNRKVRPGPLGLLC